MSFLRFGLAASALLLMGSTCGDGGSAECDSGDSGSDCDDTAGDTSDSNGQGSCTDCVPTVSTFTQNCDSTDWWFDVYMTGWSGDVEMDILQTGVDPGTGWFEYGHQFWDSEDFSNAGTTDTRGYYDPLGYWDNAYTELAIVETPGQVALGSTTLFKCTSERTATLTWAVTVTDTAGALHECVAWGHDPTFNDNDGTDLSSCRTL